MQLGPLSGHWLADDANPCRKCRLNLSRRPSNFTRFTNDRWIETSRDIFEDVELFFSFVLNDEQVASIKLVVILKVWRSFYSLI